MILINFYLIWILLLIMNYVHSFFVLKSSRFKQNYGITLYNRKSNDFITTYNGPTKSMDDMEAGCTIEDLSLKILVGNSTVCNGRGLFISIDDDVEEVTIPKGTAICGYSKGII